jgi:hypothetical protein
MYGEDNRLNIVIVKPMPRLEVWLRDSFKGPFTRAIFAAIFSFWKV